MSILTSAISDLSDSLNKGHGIETVENMLFEIVDVLRADIDRKAEFLELVEQTLIKRWPYALEEISVPRELIELAAHELKWPEFRALADRRIATIFKGDELLALGDVAQGVRKAYSDDWEDREFFERYAS